jgi:DUF971 family protein
MKAAGRKWKGLNLLDLSAASRAEQTMSNPETPVAGRPWPAEIKLHKDHKTLTVAFDNGEVHALAAEYLRVKSPSAEVQGHAPEERKTVPGKRNVAILEVHPIGNYAVRLVFDDMHSTGIYSWDYLLELGRNHAANWRDYLDELAAKSLSREPADRRRRTDDGGRKRD